MRLSHAPEGEFLLVTLDASRIDAAGALAFKDEMRALPGSADVLLDRARVTFVDSSGLGAIVAAMKALAPRRLHLAALNPTVAKSVPPHAHGYGSRSTRRSRRHSMLAETVPFPEMAAMGPQVRISSRCNSQPPRPKRGWHSPKP